ncbi:unnamed protein product [Brassicogethes aeneus]|uniref:Ig-like domain-containing protein n=1 Tax=Brassicogethes aeneus TaxID=1431903 RepID=A0A9P0BBJ2_BRAAE|nr:unnamed protein product [Brassicogethes aeneus]
MFVKLNWIIIFLILLINLIAACPPSCLCKWKNGKETVECLNKEFLIIPEGMPTATQVLEFSGNNLQILQEQKFHKLDLLNLQRIYLARCRISSIESRPFRGLSNLVELDLGSNSIDAVPTESFLDCPSLMKLTLSHNPVKALGKAAFNHLSFLTTLELNNCEISEVDRNAFQGLLALEWLNMQGNKLKYLNAALSLLDSLKGAQLHENPWYCDCHLIKLHDWLTSFKHPQSVEPICTGPPKLKNKVIKAVPTPDLACLPDVTPTTFFLEIEEGKNISLLCQVGAIPEAKISWIYQGQLIQNDSTLEPGVHLTFFVEQGTLEKKSELFIYNANSEDNGTFVCAAENSAGVSQANFTIRVVIKQEPVVAQSNEIPFEFMIVVIAAAGLSLLLLVLVLILSVVKCQRNNRLRKERENSKAAVRNTTKDNLLQDSTDESDPAKDNCNLKLVNAQEDLMLYNVHCLDEEMIAMPPTQLHVENIPFCQDQNPDIINGTEYIIQHEMVEKNCIVSKKCTLPTINEYKASESAFILPSDVRLNPMGLIQSSEVRAQKFPGNCYKTLPYNRVNKRQSAANPTGRFSHEAEFLSRSAQCAYENYENDVRYTADGYPVRTIENYAYSPPGSHKSVSSSNSEPCCSTKVQWPACVPAKLKENNVIKKSVGAQTQTECVSPKLTGSAVNVKKIVESLEEKCVDGDRL